MLTHLHIRDFAIIESVELELVSGMTALTGETGAGKSILVDAVLVAIGGRAGADVVRHGAERAEITATFAIKGNAAVVDWLSEQSMDLHDELLLRRVIGADGRSRAYVNGQVQPLQQLRLLGERLIDIHGQSEFLTLTRSDTQRHLLDAYGQHLKLIEPVEHIALEWRRVDATLRRLHVLMNDRDARFELLRYQHGELAALQLKIDEIPELLAEAQRLANHGKLATAAQEALHLLYDGDGADALARAGRALSTLRGATELDTRLANVNQLIEDSLIPLREAGLELSAYLEALDADPARQEYVQARIASCEQLARKHRVDPAGLPEVQARLSAELSELEISDSQLATLTAQAEALATDYNKAAIALSAARTKTADTLSQAVSALMHTLGMPGGVFQIAVRADAAAAIDPQGIDTVEFLVSANPGQPAKPIAKVASGGELSRMSLAVQVAAAHSQQGPVCMIFDEVDAGVGGAVAEMVGRQLHALSRAGQVLCVTHLPQVAGQADQHVRVAKLNIGKTSRTTLTPLTRDERVEELARMLGGVTITDTAREHAREMLQTPKPTAKASAKAKRER